MKKILVTGAAGLVGSAVVDLLYDAKRFPDCAVLPITRHMCDLTDPADTIRLFEQMRPNFVFHAAATVYGLGGNMQNQAKSIYENTMINTNVVHAAHRVGVEKFTAMGTNAIYPATAPLPYREQDIFSGLPHEGEMGYGLAKRHMLSMLALSDMPFAYLVSNNIYGPNDKFNTDTGHVVPSMIAKFAEAVRTGGIVTLWGDGSPERDFLYSKDLAQIVARVAFDDTMGAINTGYGLTWTIRELATHLSVISHVPMSRVMFDSAKPNGRIDCASDLTRLDTLEIDPYYTLHHGLSETWEGYCESIGLWVPSSPARA